MYNFSAAACDVKNISYYDESFGRHVEGKMESRFTERETLKFTTAVFNLSHERKFDAVKIAARVNQLEFMSEVTAGDVEAIWRTYETRAKFLRFYGEHVKQNGHNR